MNQPFDAGDLGKRILIAFDPNKVEAELFNQESYHIPYDAIIDYKIQKIAVLKTQQLIKDISEGERLVNIVDVALGLGASRVETLGEIIEVAEDHLEIKLVKKRRRY